MNLRLRKSMHLSMINLWMNQSWKFPKAPLWLSCKRGWAFYDPMTVIDEEVM